MSKKHEYSQKVIIKMMADTLHDMSPTVSTSEWEKIIIDSKGDPKAILNPDGMVEYRSFVASHDEQQHKKLLAKQKNKV